MKPHFTALDSAYQLHFYLCFKTHYLHPSFVNKEENSLVRRVLEDVCTRGQYHLLEASVNQDHVRLLLSLKPDQRVSRAVKMLKGNVDRAFRTDFPRPLQANSQA